MNFVADESCAGPVIQALRGAGHDVIAIAEVAQRCGRQPSAGARSEREACAYHRRSRFWRTGLRAWALVVRRNPGEIPQQYSPRQGRVCG